MGHVTDSTTWNFVFVGRGFETRSIKWISMQSKTEWIDATEVRLKVEHLLAWQFNQNISSVKGLECCEIGIWLSRVCKLAEKFSTSRRRVLMSANPQEFENKKKMSASASSEWLRSWREKRSSNGSQSHWLKSRECFKNLPFPYPVKSRQIEA